MNPSLSSQEKDRLFRIFAAATDGSILPAELAELQTALESSAEWRRLWFAYNDLEIGLDEWAQQQNYLTENSLLRALDDSTPPQSRPTPLPARFSRPAIAAIAAALFVAIGLALWTLPSRNGIAKIFRSHDATWRHAALANGANIPSPRMIDLASGMVEIEMSSGARIVLEGPGRIDLLSANSLRILDGRLHATVPPAARGFTLVGDDFSAVDFGTEFGCSASLSGKSEIHVFKGAVEMSPHGGDSRMLQTHEAVSLENQQLTSIPAHPEQFVSPDTLDALEAGRASTIGLARQMLRDHPHTALHLDAASSQARAIHISTAPGRDASLPALSFDGATSHMLLDTKISSENLTLIAWVKVLEPHRRQDLVTGNGPFTRGEAAWYLYQQNALGFGVLLPPTPVPTGSGWHHQHAASTPLTPNRWHMLATVAETATGTVTHYVDGQLTGVGRLNLPETMSFGNMIVGASADTRNPQHQNRFFHGSLDELTILTTALNAREIQRLHRLGSPVPSPQL